MLPPWASTIVLVIASPRPTPGIASVSTVLPRKNLVKISPSSASAMPRPVSRTLDHGHVALAPDAARGRGRRRGCT